MKNIILLLFLSTSLFTHAMNSELIAQLLHGEPQEMARKITMKDADGNFFHVDLDRAQKLNAAQNIFNISDEDDFKSDITRKVPFFYCFEEQYVLKEGSFDGINDTREDYFCPPDSYIDLARLVDRDIARRDIVETVIDVANDDITMHVIPQENIKPVMKAADYFGLPEESIQKMALHFDEFAEYDKKVHKCLQRCGIRSVADLMRDHERAQRFSNMISLAGEGLSTLYGISLKPNKDSVDFLDLSRNNFIKLDIASLLQHFPNIRILRVISSNVKNVIFPRCMSNIQITIALYNNPIECISSFKAGENGELQFSATLPQECKSVLQDAVEPNFFEKRMHYPFFAKKISLAAFIGLCSGGLLGLSSFGPSQTNHGGKHAWIENVIKLTAYFVTKSMQLAGAQLKRKTIIELESAEFIAKWLALGGSIVTPIALYFLPGGSFYKGYPVFQPTKIIYS